MHSQRKAASFNSPPTKVPPEFICPITHETMEYPLMTRWGCNFERSAILNKLQQSSKCPLTGRPLKITDLVPNHSLRIQISFWLEENGLLRSCKDLCLSSDDIISPVAILSVSSQPKAEKLQTTQGKGRFTLSALVHRSTKPRENVRQSSAVVDLASITESETSFSESDHDAILFSKAPVSTWWNDCIDSDDVPIKQPGELHTDFLARILAAASKETSDNY